jgi:hypothetical protein
MSFSFVTNKQNTTVQFIICPHVCSKYCLIFLADAGHGLMANSLVLFTHTALPCDEFMIM